MHPELLFVYFRRQVSSEACAGRVMVTPSTNSLQAAEVFFLVAALLFFLRALRREEFSLLWLGEENPRLNEVRFYHPYPYENDLRYERS